MWARLMMNLKGRLLAPWTIRRIIYTVVGGIIAVMAIMDQSIFLALGGGYFFFMGLLAYGCAGGNCSVPARFSPEEENEEVITEG